MGVIWHKVWFDLWHNKTRTVLAVLSIASGVFAVGSMFGMADMMLTTMDRSHQSTMPPHINVGLTSYVNRDTLLNLATLPGVEGIEPYNEVGITYRLGPGKPWRQGVVHMADNWLNQQYELLQLRQGTWPAGKDDLGVERMAATYDHLGIGDPVTFKIGNQERTIPITSLIRHPFVPPPMIFDLSFFFMSDAGMQRFDVPEGAFNSFYVRVTPYSPGYARDVANAIKDKLAKQDIGVGNFAYQDPSRHWGRDYMDGFVLVLQVLAIISVVTSAILVYNTLSNLITQQTDQIGILKAIGSGQGTIVAIYSVGALVLGTLALIVGLPLSTMVAFGVSRYFLNLFNIDFNQFQVSTGAVGLTVVSALAAPVLAGLPPILQGARITVRDAIASYGLGGRYGTSRIDRAVDRVGERWLSSPYATALGNMFRRKGRLLLTELVLVAAGTSFLMVMSLNSSIGLTMERIYARSQYDAALQFAGSERAEQVNAIVGNLAGVDRVELSLVQSASMFASGQLVKEAGIGTSIQGIPAGSDFYKPLIVEGRWLLPQDGRAIVISRDASSKNNIQVGDTVTLDLGELGKETWRVVGLYDPIFVGGGFSAETVYAPLDALFKATKKFGQGTLLYVRTANHDAASTTAITANLRTLLDNRGLKVVLSQTQSDVRKTNAFQFGMVITMMLALSIIVALVGGIALMGALSIGVIERTKEIGVMRAVGARSRTILGIFIMEGMLQGLLSWLIAFPVSVLASPALAAALGKAMFGARLDYTYNWTALLIWLLAILGVSALASIVPANRATRISVRDSLAYA